MFELGIIFDILGVFKVSSYAWNFPVNLKFVGPQKCLSLGI